MKPANGLRKSKYNDLNVEIGLDNIEWTNEKLEQINAFVKDQAKKRSPERQLKNEMLSVKYKMEAYLDDDIHSDKALQTVESFLNSYLKILKLTFKKFSTSIDMTDGNLKKYLSGERKFNADLAFKFASFFHTTPDLWLRVDMKNQLLDLNKNKAQNRKYAKYNYEKVLA